MRLRKSRALVGDTLTYQLATFHRLMRSPILASNEVCLLCSTEKQQIDIDLYLVLAKWTPQCLNNVQGANCIEGGGIETLNVRLSTGYSTEHPHNRLSREPTKLSQVALPPMSERFQFRLVALTIKPFRMTNGYMMEREKIQHGTRLRPLRQRDGVALVHWGEWIRYGKRLGMAWGVACTGMTTGRRIDTTEGAKIKNGPFADTSAGGEDHWECRGSQRRCRVSMMSVRRFCACDTLADFHKDLEISENVFRLLDNQACSFYDLRHTCVSLMAEAGAPPKYVHEQLGPSSIQVTMDIYCTCFRAGIVNG